MRRTKRQILPAVGLDLAGEFGDLGPRLGGEDGGGGFVALADEPILSTLMPTITRQQRLVWKPMDDYLQANQQLWNEWTILHEQAPQYKVAEFKAGASTLRPVERAELTNVAGKQLLHLQCHFGLDTLSWACEGAIVTGVDLSDRSIALARSLSSELNIPATFVCTDLLDLPSVLSNQFDIVFTSYGVLNSAARLERLGCGDCALSPAGRHLLYGGISSFLASLSHRVTGTQSDQPLLLHGRALLL